MLLNSQNLSVVWLTQCLCQVPITIYTDEEKRTLLLDVVYASEKLSRRQAEALEEENSKMDRPLPEGRKLVPIFLYKKLQSELKFLEDELTLIYRRAKNYVRR